MTTDQVKTYNVLVFIIINVIPIIFLSFFYTAIVYKLWHPDQMLTNEISAQPKHQKSKNFVEKTRRKTTLMLLTVIMVFFFCMFPQNVLNLVLTFRDLKEFDLNLLRHAVSILRVLLVVNSASNPIIYNFLSEKFRTGFQSIFSCRCRALSRVAPTTDAETVLT